jgi:UDP-N-acetylmuramoyl-tripeptide--D-alanyl-D-alanine ligase
MILTAAMIAAATGGTLTSGNPDRIVGGVAIDSRTIQHGELFFAIVAARDGHGFVADALIRGAAGAVVSETAVLALPAPTPGVPTLDADPLIVRVADTTRALQDLARRVRQASRARVVAITGSAGKTTTKDTIAALLSSRHRVVKNQGNLNNHLGLPLSLLQLRFGADVAVMELGMSHAGEIRLLADIARPEIRVWTNVGDAHIGYFASQSAIADAKAEILEGASTSDVLVCNADDPLVMARVPGFPGRMVPFGAAGGALVRADEIDDLGLDGSRFRLVTPRGTVRVRLPLVGRGNLSNVLAAASVAHVFEIPLAEVAEACERLQPSPHRGAVLRLSGGLRVVDDSYNSSPSALARALETIGREPAATRKAAVLGEMLELGAHSERLHQASGRAAAAAGLHRLIAVGGPSAGALADAAIAAGMQPDTVTWSASSDEAADLILSWLTAGDVLLVKGSRAVQTDLVVDRITREWA